MAIHGEQLEAGTYQKSGTYWVVSVRPAFNSTNKKSFHIGKLSLIIVGSEGGIRTHTPEGIAF